MSHWHTQSHRLADSTLEGRRNWKGGRGDRETGDKIGPNPFSVSLNCGHDLARLPMGNQQQCSRVGDGVPSLPLLPLSLSLSRRSGGPSVRFALCYVGIADERAGGMSNKLLGERVGAKATFSGNLGPRFVRGHTGQPAPHRHHHFEVNCGIRDKVPLLMMRGTNGRTTAPRIANRES